MTILQPITTKSPSNVDVLERSGIPFGFNLTPIGSAKYLQEDDRLKVERKNLVTRNSGRRQASQQSCKTNYPLKASLLARCDNCGSPLNPYSSFISSWTVLCGLCGKTYSVDYQTQREGHTVTSSFISGDMEYDEAEYRSRYARTQSLEECSRPLIEYSLPLFSVPRTARQESGGHTTDDVYALPAQLCPPLWVIFIDATCTEPSYYSYICKRIKTVLDRMRTSNPTRLGIFCMTQSGGLSFFDLSNPGGHLKHLWVGVTSPQDDGDVIPLSKVTTAEEVFTPLDSDFSRSCVKSALRAIEDSSITIGLACHRNRNRGQHSQSTGKESGGAHVGSTLHYFLDFMKDVAYHPGEAQMDHSHQFGTVNEKFMYAGGTIMCFLSGAPDEVGKVYIGGHNGMGGMGGACSEIGKRFELNGTNRRPHFSNDGQEDIEYGGQSGGTSGEDAAKDDFKSGNSIQEEQIPQTKYKYVAEYYQEIGKRSALASFAVEVFGLQYEDEKGNTNKEFMGIPLLRLLSDRSGGSGPIIVGYSTREETFEGRAEILMREMEARSPWRRNHAFGTVLRIRTSPSLRVEKNKKSFTGKKSMKTSHQLHRFYQSNGLYGSITALDNDDGVFYIGACDDSHTLSFNLQICASSGSLIDEVFVDGRGEILLTPCVQTCVAFTSIVQIDGKYVTVRRLRVLTKELKLTDSVEALTLSLDAEALAVALYHKFYHHALKYGLHAVEDYAVNWILGVLLSCYQSSVHINRSVSQYGSSIAKEFNPCDRLLNIDGGNLSKREILLAKGHIGLQYLPLMVFALIQCDALRPKSGGFNPSIDSRAAAAANMGNMPSSSVARCIAPRMELWLGDGKSDAAVHENIEMNMNALRFTIIENIDHYDDSVQEDYTGPVPLLLLDSPNRVLIYDCRELCNLRPSVIKDLPKALEKSIDEAVNSYRVQPQSSCFVGYGEATPKEAMYHLHDSMIEDSCTSKGESYEQWCTRIAEYLYSEISTNKILE